MENNNSPRISMACDCGKVHDLRRTIEIPDYVISMGCNFCPTCEDSASEPYEEWYIPNNDNGDDPADPEPNDPNQLMLFSVADEITADRNELITEQTITV